jgi:hypothetical protein
MGKQATDVDVKTTTVERHLDQATADAHELVPGDWCVLLNEEGFETGRWGIVCNSLRNTAHTLEVRLGADPIRTFPRRKLRWLGPLD